MPKKSPPHEKVVLGVKRLVRYGLPLLPTQVEPVLLELRGVIARAADPTDTASLTTALESTLRTLLARFPDAHYASAVRAIFGLPPAQPNTNLTIRRILGAELANHEVHHFRKRIEPKLIDKVAYELLTDADKFTHSQMIAPRLSAISERQLIQPDPFAWELSEQEEQLCKLWSVLYTARASLLAIEKLVSLQAPKQDLVYAAITAAWHWSIVRAQTIDYAASYKPDLDVDEFVALAGWVPALTLAQISTFTEAGTGHSDRDQFINSLDPALINAWVQAFLNPIIDTNEKGLSL